jgi:hypothetical protein
MASLLEFPLATEEEIPILNQMKEILGELLTNSPVSTFPEIVGDYHLLRLLRAKSGNLNKAIQLFHDHLSIREEFNMNEIRLSLEGSPVNYKQTDITYGKEVSKYYRIYVNAGFSPAYHHPVAISFAGQHHTRNLFKEVGVEKFNRYVIEEMIRRQMQLDQLSRLHNKLIKVILIPNVAGISIWHISHSEMRDNQKKVLRRIQQTIPELLARAYAVNTSWLVRNFYNTVVKWMLPVETRSKIFLLGKNFRDDLAQEIDTSTLARIMSVTDDEGEKCGGTSGDSESSSRSKVDVGVLTKSGTFNVKAGSTEEVLINVKPDQIQQLKWSVNVVTNDIAFQILRFSNNFITDEHPTNASQRNTSETKSGVSSNVTTKSIVFQQDKIVKKSEFSGTLDISFNKNKSVLFVLQFNNQQSWIKTSIIEWKYEMVTRNNMVVERKTRYGGTISPCDDLNPVEVGERTGFHVKTRIDQSCIDGAGLGRFAMEFIPARTIIRSQSVNSNNLFAFKNEKELLSAFPLDEDLNMLSDFAFCSDILPDVVLLDVPPTMVNHATEKNGSNTSFRFFNNGKSKEVIATRDIMPGDELLQDYRKIAPVSWLENILKRKGLKTARELGEMLENTKVSDGGSTKVE